jgi:hypothetical protein
MLLIVMLGLLAGDAGQHPSLVDWLAGVGAAEEVTFDQVPAGKVDQYDVLVWDTHSRALPAEALRPRVVAAMRGYVEEGGSLLLLSFATSYLHELGLEPVPADRHDTRVLGFESSGAGGSYTFGVEALEPGHALFRGLLPYADTDRIFMLAGAHAIPLESCFWEQGQPRQCQVIGTYYRNMYGEDRAFGHRCLVEGGLGQGKVLAYGLGPLFAPGTRWGPNLDRFLRNCLVYLTGSDRGLRIGVLPSLPAQLGIDEYASEPTPPQSMPSWAECGGPNLPYIAHWGWHGQIDYQRPRRESAGIDYFKSAIVDESASWGANLLEFYTPDMTHGFPMGWSDNDPIPRPETYWGGLFDPLWPRTEMYELTEYAHRRGMLIHSFFHPNPVGGDIGVFAAFTEKTWRDMSNPLLLGWEHSWDGFGWEWFPADQEAVITSALWKYNPGTYLHSTAILPAYTPNFSGAWMCARGRLGGINACGLSDSWRHVLHPPLYLAYQADCRSKRPSTREWGGWAGYGGGSYPDWILRQVNDFARDRLDADSAIWWLGEPESTLPPEYRDYVYGISMDPIRCAVACSLAATGEGGYRETVVRLSADPPPGYVSGPPFPQSTSILQNNYMRLYRRSDDDEGVLECDPGGLARFPGDRPSSQVLRMKTTGWPVQELSEVVLTLGKKDGGASGDGPGGYSRFCDIGPEVGPLPNRIAYEADPEWPGALRIHFDAKVGRHLIRIGQLAEETPSTLEVFLDGRPIGFYLTEPSDAVHEFGFGVVEPGPHEVTISIQKGPGHGVDFIEIRRISNRAVFHEYLQKAGVEAVLRETVACDASGTIHSETRTYMLRADSRELHVDITATSGKPPTALHLQASNLAPTRAEGSSQARTIRVLEGAESSQWLALRSSLAPQPGAPGDPDTWRLTLGDQPCMFDLGLLSSPEEGEKFISCPEAVPPSPRADGNVLAIAPEDYPRTVAARFSRPPTLDGRFPQYFVRETDADGRAWWTVRGAQRAGEIDLVKVHSGPGRPARVLRAEFLPCGFRPAWGCQYALAFQGDTPHGSCVVRVAKTGPFLFAPRVEFDRDVSGVRLNGRDWRYFDGSVVFLPNRPGDYRIQVSTSAERAPSLARTFLDVADCSWDGRTLTLVTQPPSWYTLPLPGGKPYTAMLLTDGRPVEAVEGAEVIPWDEYPLARTRDREIMQSRGVMLRLFPGKAAIRFGERPLATQLPAPSDRASRSATRTPSPRRGRSACRTASGCA